MLEESKQEELEESGENHLEPLLELDAVTCIFETNHSRTCAVQDFSAQFYRGEVVGMLGANGAGKSTTLKTMATLLEPTSGRVLFRGSPVKECLEVMRKELGFLSPETGLFPRLTGREMLRFVLELNAWEGDIEERINVLSQELSLTDFIDEWLEDLSTGMYQRVNIARSFIHDPELVIFDEPTSGLDTVTSIDFCETVKKLRGENKCIVLSSHIMTEVEALCDRIIFIQNGIKKVDNTIPKVKQELGIHKLEELFSHFLETENEGCNPV